MDWRKEGCTKRSHKQSRPHPSPPRWTERNYRKYLLLPDIPDIPDWCPRYVPDMPQVFSDRSGLRGNRSDAWTLPPPRLSCIIIIIIIIIINSSTQQSQVVIHTAVIYLIIQ